MSLSKFNGRVVLSATNLADTSSGAKTSWNATFAFTDNSGVYLGSNVAVGDIIALDTSSVDLGTVTIYSITSVVSSTFSSFRVVMSYLASNANPGGAPDVSAAIGIAGVVSRRSVGKNLATLPTPGIQSTPELLSYQLANNNAFDIVDSLSGGTATSLTGGVAGSVVYQSAPNVTGFTAAGALNQVLVSNGAAAPAWANASSLTVSSAATATSLLGAAWAIPYQSALNVTSMLTAGTTGQVLTSNGAAAPSWQAVTATTATTQAYGDNTTNIATTAFVDRLRSSPTSTSTTAALADRGKTLTSAAGVTIPASIFAAGDCFSVYNNSAANITLTSGAGLTLWLVGTATTGNRTLAQRGIATVYYISATEAVITGGGLS
jgi:hypothetical protein